MRRHYKAFTTVCLSRRRYPYALCGVEGRVKWYGTLVKAWTDTPTEVTCKRCQTMLRKKGAHLS